MDGLVRNNCIAPMITWLKRTGLSFEIVFKVIVYATEIIDAEQTQSKRRVRVNL
jgi:hypothetical protein